MKGLTVAPYTPRPGPWWLAALAGLLLFCADVTPGLAQENGLSGILNVNFGSSMAEARMSFLLHDGVLLDTAHSDDNNLVYDGGRLAGQPVAFWILGFVDDQMHTGKAIVQPQREHLIAVYEALVANFTATYGAPTYQVARFDDPYELGDGFETHAISFGKGHFSTLWKFSDEDSENAISITIDENLYIPIVYQNGRLIDMAIEQQESAALSGL